MGNFNRYLCTKRTQRKQGWRWQVINDWRQWAWERERAKVPFYIYQHLYTQIIHCHPEKYILGEREREGKGRPFHIYQHLYIYRGQTNNTAHCHPEKYILGREGDLFWYWWVFSLKFRVFRVFKLVAHSLTWGGASAAVTSLSSLDWKPLLQLQLRLKRKLKRKIRRKLKKSNENVTALYGLKPLLAST